ncbi:hypothetical protein D3C72_567270 [compost metagenome]
MAASTSERSASCIMSACMWLRSTWAESATYSLLRLSVSVAHMPTPVALPAMKKMATLANIVFCCIDAMERSRAVGYAAKK